MLLMLMMMLLLMMMLMSLLSFGQPGHNLHGASIWIRQEFSILGREPSL